MKEALIVEIPVEYKRALKAIARKQSAEQDNDVTMTSIVNGLIEDFLIQAGEIEAQVGQENQK